MKNGIDISQWQGDVDFSKVKNQVDFVILREGYRKTIDPKFMEYVQGCQTNGIPIAGVYHFSYATNSTEAREEAKSCIANIKKAGLGKDTIVFYDFEYDSVKDAKAKGIILGKSECILFTNTFCSFVNSQGYRAGVYSNMDYYNSMYNKETINKYIFWLADYSGKADVPCVYHQYTSKGIVSGIADPVDMDYYYGNEAKTMTVRMSNCGHDERNKYSGGQAGDQSGSEWYLREWYAYPWNYVIRWKDSSLGDLCADLAVEAAENQLIGYDQNQRDSFWSHLKASNYRPSQITIPCEADCSSGTIAIIKAVGYLKGIPELQKCSATYTGNMLPWFQSTSGKKHFEVLTGKYLTSSKLARRGDINLNTVHHVNITVDNGSESAKPSASPSEILKKGDKGESVQKMQEMLIACGYSVGPDGVDGDFGVKTESAVKLFQRNYGLSADGQYGPLTRTKLESVYKMQTSKKSIEEVAQEVLQGKWGNGAERKKKLEAAGYDYAKVQAAVNRLMS